MSSTTCTQTKNVHLLSAASKKIMKYQNIAPAPSLTASTSNSTAGEETKARKYSQRTVAYSSDPTQSVLRRNARERNRVKQVNNSFARLRQHIPQTIIADLTKSGGRGPHKKISKVDTLRIAVEYIRRLQDLLEDLNCNSSSNDPTNSQQYSSNILLNTNSTNTTATASNNNSNNSKAIADSTLTTFTSNPTNLVYYPAQTANAVVEVLNRNFLETTPTSVQPEQLNFHHSTTLLSPISLSSYSPQHNSSTQLDKDCNSPTSSFNSNLSFDSGTYDHNSQPQQQKPRILPPQVMCPPEANLESNLQLKFEPYENFHLDDDDCTPDDEEILDYISLWQDQ